MYADEGQWGSTLPVYQILVEYVRKPGSTAHPYPILQRLSPNPLNEVAHWELDDRGGVLFDAVDLGKKLGDYYAAVRKLRDVDQLDVACETRFTIGRKIFTDIWYKVEANELHLGNEDWAVDHATKGNPDQVIVFKWRSKPGNAGLRPGLGRTILAAAHAADFELISYNLSSFTSEWDGWRIFQSRGKKSIDFKNDVLAKLKSTLYSLTYQVSSAGLRSVIHTSPPDEGSVKHGLGKGSPPLPEDFTDRGKRHPDSGWRKGTTSSDFPAFACRRAGGPANGTRGAMISK